MNDSQLEIQQKGVLGIIRLNRVASLNALSVEMIEGIHQHVLAWQNDPQVEAILIGSNSPKAFSAGGDIRYIYDSYYAGKNQHLAYFELEYDMLNSLRHSKKPIIAFLDGYVLGGGFGLAQACQLRVTSEKSRFSMPETIIGYFPDVGATHFLSKLNDVGKYLALTGEQMSASDALHYQLVDFYVNSDQFSDIEYQLIQATSLNQKKIEALISSYSVQPKLSELQQKYAHIQHYFGFDNIADIESTLAQYSHDVWEKTTLALLQQRSPIAKRVSLQLQILGQNLTLDDALLLEQRVQNLWFEQGDFIEGVRALIIDKDKQPRWREDQPNLNRQILALLSEYPQVVNV